MYVDSMLTSCSKASLCFLAWETTHKCDDNCRLSNDALMRVHMGIISLKMKQKRIIKQRINNTEILLCQRHLPPLQLQARVGIRHLEPQSFDLETGLRFPRKAYHRHRDGAMLLPAVLAGSRLQVPPATLLLLLPFPQQLLLMMTSSTATLAACPSSVNV